MDHAIKLIVELAAVNGYTLEDEVVAVYSIDKIVKSRKMSLKDSLDKLQMKLEKDVKTIGIDFKVIM